MITTLLQPAPTEKTGPTLIQASKPELGARTYTLKLSTKECLSPSSRDGFRSGLVRGVAAFTLPTFKEPIPHRHTHDVSRGHMGEVKRHFHPFQQG